jgi:hypothetical protein
VITAPSSLDIPQFRERFGLDLTLIGEVGEGPIGVVITENGEPVTLPAGYLHFTE